MSLGKTAVLPRERVRSLAADVPVWAWLAGLVAVSAVVRWVLARSSPAPWIFVDELIYSELAKGFAGGHGFEIRDVPAGGAYGVLYPVLISPAYAVFDLLPHAYAAAKAINAVVMSLAAVPAYLLARRLVGQWPALGVAVLTVAVPSMAYTGTIMTENAFYPAFLAAVLGIVLALERPTTARQLWALALIAVAFLIRVQAVALVVAFATAIVVFALLDERAARKRLRPGPLFRRLTAFWPTWLLLGGGVVLLAVVQVARSRPVTEILGAYRAAGRVGYSAGDVARWFLYHVAELDLYLAVIPFAAFLLVAVGAFRRAEPSRDARIFAAVSVPAVLWTTLLVATFASQPSVSRIEERNMFYVAPLFFLALAVWVERGRPRLIPAAGAAALAAGLVATIPFTRFINPSAVSDTLALLPWWNLQDSVITGPQVRPVAVAVSACLGVFFVLVPRRFAVLAPALVLVAFALAAKPIAQRIEQASVGSLYSGTRSVPREWIDDALPDGATAAVVWSGNTSRYVVWVNEVFNRSVGPVYDTSSPLPGNLPETPLHVDGRTGTLLDPAGLPVQADYALSDGTEPLGGQPLARDAGLGITLYRVDGPLLLTAQVKGMYPADTWSGPELTYTRHKCSGGKLLVTLTSDPHLFHASQAVTASVGGHEVARTRVRPDARDQPLSVPLSAEGGRCVVRFTVTPTAVPAQVLGGDDTRELGIHFTSFRYEAP